MNIKPQSARRHGFALGVVATASTAGLVYFATHAPNLSECHIAGIATQVAGSLGAVFLFIVAASSVIAGLTPWGNEEKKVEGKLWL